MAEKEKDLSKISIEVLDSMYSVLVNSKCENPLKDKIKEEIQRRVNSKKEARENK